jgi:hypothetical protein
VPASGSYLESSFDMLLAFDLLKISLGDDGQIFGTDGRLGRNEMPAGKVPVRLGSVLTRMTSRWG